MARQVLGRGLSALLGEENSKSTGEELLDLASGRFQDQ